MKDLKRRRAINGLRYFWSYLWAAPATLVGVLVALLAVLMGAHLQLRAGLLEVTGRNSERFTQRKLGHLGKRHAQRLLASLPMDVITLGHVVVARNATAQSRWRAHERVHVRQYERWGALFFLLYGLSSLWQWLRGRDPYRDNCFEQEAFKVDVKTSENFSTTININASNKT